MHAASPYVGSDACAKCHRDEYDRQVRSRHAHALRPIGESPIADVLLRHDARDGLAYKSSNGRIVVEAGKKGTDAAGELEWAFGAGAQGITPVGRMLDSFFENQFSLYTAADGLAVTYGHPKAAGNSAAMLGLVQSTRAITSCFGCHATNVQTAPDAPDLSGMKVGVQCERCHGPGQDHAASPASKFLVNPARFPAKAQVEMCGECHRLPSPGETLPEPEIADPVSVRFAPIGLMASRCFIVSKRLSCVTCHDPHEDAQPRSAMFYSTRCAGCHAGVHRATKQNCLPCHMLQASLSLNLKFTDHRIRVY